MFWVFAVVVLFILAAFILALIGLSEAHAGVNRIMTEVEEKKSRERPSRIGTAA